MRQWIGVLFGLGLIALSGSARAQLFSPGVLARGHHDLEGLAQCKKCHDTDQVLSPRLCLECHEELAPSLEAKTGYHGRMAPADRDCQKCHHEHRGLGSALIEWTEEKFDHREAGYALDGKHARVKCADCHDVRLIVLDPIKKLAKKAGKAKTFLGLSTRCVACHFDEHRGQEGDDCARCHDATDWKPARAFDHAKSEFALKGAHAKVECAKCHKKETDTGPSDRFPKPVAATFDRYKPVAHEACTDCHADPHEGRFDPNCTSCHDEESWAHIRLEQVEAPSFHDRTRYPLTGQHKKVACKACHLPLGKAKEVYRGLPFDRCDACHLDAHQGQVGTECETCHDVEGFAPSLYTTEAHAKTRYPIEGAHLAVACRRCHEPKKEALPEWSRAEKRALVLRGRTPPVSAIALKLPGTTTCARCHVDPHAGQFATLVSEKGCEACHGVESFSKLRFDHDRDSKFRLLGQHAKTACAGCHQPKGKERVVQYRPLETACASCHQDPHAGQLGAACERCHGNESFPKHTFDLAAHAKTHFAIEGRHEKVACEKCHAMVAVSGRQVRRYLPLPLDCAGCHADFHRGAFDRLLVTMRALVPVTPPSLATGPGVAIKIDTAPKDPCARCHSVKGWLPASFEHDWTGFALNGAHREARCSGCHGEVLSASVTSECAGCHRDVHASQLGLHCEGCHQEKDWKSRFDVDAHRRTAFPLSGTHAAIPCEECHVDAPGRGFVRAGASCIRCHLADYQRTGLTSIDHLIAGFDLSCQRCHTPWKFTRAAYADHDNCFGLSSGPHSDIRCRDCHKSISTLKPDGLCSTNNAACTGCHEHTCDRTNGQHQRVEGYECKDRRCYECHRFTAP